MTHIFCVRHFNDIDNIAPIIYYFLSNETEESVLLISYRGYNVNEDPNAKFLKSVYRDRIKLKNVYEDLNADFNISLFTKKTLFGKIYRRFQKYIKGIGSYEISSDYFKYLYDDFVDGLLSEYSDLSVTVYFDQIRVHMASGILHAFKERNFRLVCLPVSPLANINTVRMSREGYCTRDIYAEKGVYQDHDYSLFDTVVFTDDNYYQHLEKYFLSKKAELKIKNCEFFGSIRYTRDWIKIRDESIIPRLQDSDKRSGKPIISFFLSNFKNNVFEDEVQRAIRILSEYDEIDFFIKPHPRNMNFSLDEKFSNITLSTEDSSRLIDRSDYVMTWGSSIFFEALQKEKPLIYIKYLHINTNLMDVYDIGKKIHTRDDLIILLDSITAGERLQTDEGSISLFKQEVIKESSCVKNYISYIKINKNIKV